MFEVLFFSGLALGLSWLSAEGGLAASAWSVERKRKLEAEEAARKAEDLLVVRSRLRSLEVQMKRHPALPAVDEEYDRLLLEERMLQAEDL